MISVSQDFAPPFKLIAPYFIIGTFFLLISVYIPLNINIENLHYLDPKVLGWVHILLLGFVMMIIFGAMAQLIPVTLEVGHFSIEFYYIIWPLLLFGTILMGLGFFYSSALLPYGGTIVLISMFIFLAEVFLTIKKVNTFSNVIKYLFISNIFLLLGVVVGIVLALTYAGLINTNINQLLKAHVFLLVAGYICITIMALSLILLPMFGLSHNYTKKPLNFAVIFMSIAVTISFFSNVFNIPSIEYLAYIFLIFSVSLFLYQVLIIYKTRARKENDIYVLSLFTSFGSLLISSIAIVSYFLWHYQTLILCAGWVFFMGFFTFLISGHIYKIVPFLVWFEKFSPLVGKQKVPMLIDMVPVSASKFQFWFSLAGLIISTIGILFSSDDLFKSGVSFLIIGTIFLFKNLIYMIRFK
ncbi:MAG: hypothetical protein GY932_13700 [Arcobacter sp.]|nr:hypothetical protein [Arcobacter sp.]